MLYSVATYVKYERNIQQKTGVLAMLKKQENNGTRGEL